MIMYYLTSGNRAIPLNKNECKALTDDFLNFAIVIHLIDGDTVTMPREEFVELGKRWEQQEAREQEEKERSENI